MCDITRFVQFIEKYPCLYNHTLSEYAKKDITEKAWNEVANEMKWPVADCKEKWRNIRNGFVRSLKPAASGSSSKQRRQYYLHDVMQFVVPFVKPLLHIENSGNFLPPPSEESEGTEERGNDMIDTTEEAVAETRIETRRKRKLKSSSNEVDKIFIKYLQEKTKNSTEDHRKMFLLSLLPDVHKLSDSQVREFKMKTLTLLDEILSRPGHQPNTSPFSLTPPSNTYPHSPTPSVALTPPSPPSTYSDTYRQNM